MDERVREYVDKTSKNVNLHAETIISANFMSPRETTKVIDALVMEPEIIKQAIGKDVYDQLPIKPSLSKPMLNINDDQEILQLQTFKTFLDKYTNDQGHKQHIQEITRQQDKLKAKLTNEEIPADMQKKKDSIQEAKKAIASTVNPKQEKDDGRFNTFPEMIKKVNMGESEKADKINHVYNFIVQYGDKNLQKKSKIAPGESGAAFYKRMNTDFMLSSIREMLVKEEADLNNKIQAYKKKNVKADTKPATKSTPVEKRNYTQEALKIFREKINDYPSISETFYLPQDVEDMKMIQKFFKKHLEATLPEINMNDIVSDINTPRETLQRVDNTIHLNPTDYLHIKQKKELYQELFITGNWDVKSFLTNRLIEYIAQEMLEYKVAENFKRSKTYKGTTFEIKKTGIQDDNRGADYVVFFKVPGRQESVAAVDLMISQKDGGKGDDINDDDLKQKDVKAKEGKILYETNIELFKHTHEKQHTVKPLKRHVEKVDPVLIYSILSRMVKDKKMDIKNLIQSLQTKGELFITILGLKKDPKTLDRLSVDENKMIRRLETNIFSSLESMAA